ncbi:hypothetical protein C8Q76DRAFT_790630 [Earliella scabrosa]|nr:hypothetical protein C8Q76DRAFT_790630 [Earliella scabrosa]
MLAAYTGMVVPLTVQRRAGSLDSLFPSLDDTLGALLIGTFVTLMLYGLLVHQTYRYLRLYKTDALVLRLIAFGLLITDTVYCATLIDLCYHFLVKEYSKILALAQTRWHVHFSTPARTLTDSLGLPRTGLIATNAAKAFMSDTTAGSLLSVYRHLDSILFGVAIAIDCALTGALVIILRGRRTQFKRTNGVLDALALYAVIATVLNTTLTIPAFALVSYILAVRDRQGDMNPASQVLTQPDNFIWIAIGIPVCQVYSNSVLAMLNCRASLNNAEGGAVVCISTPMGSGRSQHTQRTSELGPGAGTDRWPSSASSATVTVTGDELDLPPQTDDGDMSAIGAILRLLEEGMEPGPEATNPVGILQTNRD